MANKRLKGGGKLQSMRPKRKAKFGKAPGWVPAAMGGPASLGRWGLSKLLNPHIKRKVQKTFEPKPPSKKPSTSTPSRSPMKSRIQGRGRR